MPTIDEMKLALENLDPMLVAGMLTNTRIPDAPIDGNHLRSSLNARGLNGALVPATRNELFDFQNACRSVATKRGKNFTGGVRVEVGEVKSDATECVYQITHATVDKQNRVIDHAKEMRVVYSKGFAARHDPISVEIIDPANAQTMELIEQRVRAHFAAHKGKQPGAKVRAIVRDIFRSIDGTRWSSSNSVWFVPVEHAQELAKLQSALREVYPADAGLEFDTIPLPNIAGVTNIVQDKVALNARSDAEKLLNEIGERLSKPGAIKQDSFVRVAEDRRRISDYVDRMSKRLGEEVSLAEETMKLLDAQLMEMMARIA